MAGQHLRAFALRMLCIVCMHVYRMFAFGINESIWFRFNSVVVVAILTNECYCHTREWIIFGIMSTKRWKTNIHPKYRLCAWSWKILSAFDYSNESPISVKFMQVNWGLNIRWPRMSAEQNITVWPQYYDTYQYNGIRAVAIHQPSIIPWCCSLPPEGPIRYGTLVRCGECQQLTPIMELSITALRRPYEKKIWRSDSNLYVSL